MARRIDINADLGEGYGTDEAMLGIVSSANIACGFHAGDAQTMRDVSRCAAERSVGVGAHPSFDDLGGFGRTIIHMTDHELESLVAYQIGQMVEAAAEAGVPLIHVKPHGALYTVAAKDAGQALAVGRAIKAVDPNLIYLGFAGSHMERAAAFLGLAFASEAFADRHYDDSGCLLLRNVQRSVISDPNEVAERVTRMVEESEVVTPSGKKLALRFDSICVHGDEPTAVVVARAVRRAVEDCGAVVVSLAQIVRNEPIFPRQDGEDRITA